MNFLSRPAALIAGPYRAVAVLCVTQILGWGALFYPPALTMTYIAQAHGWSLPLAMSGFSIALCTSGLAAPYACGLIDRHGGNPVMAAGALVGAAGLLLLPFAPNYPVYVVAWLLIGAAISSCLYDPAFTTLTRIFGMGARRPITMVTFVGGLASTTSWPAVHFLIEFGGWRCVYFVLAATLAFVVAPLHWFALPRHAAPQAAVQEKSHAPSRTIPAKGLPFVLMAAGFAGHAFTLSGAMAHLLPIFERGGLGAGLAVTIGTVFGPAQLLTRLADFLTKGRLHPLWVARVSMGVMAFAFGLLAVAGVAPVQAIVFAVLFGAANGVVSIARGALPLAFFGTAGYGRVVGRISQPGQILQAFAPFIVAFAMEGWSGQAALEILCATAAFSFICFVMLRRP